MTTEEAAENMTSSLHAVSEVMGDSHDVVGIVVVLVYYSGTSTGYVGSDKEKDEVMRCAAEAVAKARARDPEVSGPLPS